MELFIDCVDLRAGRRWREQLLEAIRACPAFVLFWSSYASRSSWVTWEWRTALEEKSETAFHVQPLEPVRSAPLPEELAHLHFGDFLLNLRQSG